MARREGLVSAAIYDPAQRQPFDARMLVTKKADLINPSIWIPTDMDVQMNFNGLITAVNSDGDNNGIYYLADRKLVTEENYQNYNAALEAGLDTEQYFSMWIKLAELNELIALEAQLKALIGDLPEGKTLVELIESNGSNLTPVDGTLTIIDNTIKVNIASDPNNALTAVEGGLFVAKTSAPRYLIEKQIVAEEGYSATYKLQCIDGEDITYVGDSINIPKDKVLESVSLQTVKQTNVPYEGAVVGEPYIQMVFNDPAASNIYLPVRDLVDVYTAGSGIEIIDNSVAVKIANNSNGLVAVDGALALNIATQTQNGAMSKEDKKALDNLVALEIKNYYATKDYVAQMIQNELTWEKM